MGQTTGAPSPLQSTSPKVLRASCSDTTGAQSSEYSVLLFIQCALTALTSEAAHWISLCVSSDILLQTSIRSLFLN